ncbi:MAG TPA: hypothetical protein VM243_11870 [Phycisphaerae bacterium]|nr:hypothetical protein [Phycisphaerae bacterium]
MADLFRTTLDTSLLNQAITAMPEALRIRVQEACRVSASHIVREMKNRLSRQLSPTATGVTVAGILTEPSYTGEGWIVRTTDVLGEAEVARRQAPDPGMRPSKWLRRSQTQYWKEAHVGLYLEKGTAPGKRRNRARTARRPFFYASLELEAPAHERRLLTAMVAAAGSVGLGG